MIGVEVGAHGDTSSTPNEPGSSNVSIGQAATLVASIALYYVIRNIDFVRLLAIWWNPWTKRPH